jgi:hypothetical protein
VRFYPSAARPFRRTLGLDLAVLLALLVFGWLGVRVHDAVTELNSLSRGVVATGTTVQQRFRDAGNAVADAPLVGKRLRDSLQGAGRETGGSVIRAGREGEQRVDALASLLAWLTFAIPTVMLLLVFLPGRVRQIGRLTAGSLALEAGAQGEERRRLIAQRAAFGLPYGVLLRHTRDPLGDLEAGHYDALIDAEREAAGLR